MRYWFFADSDAYKWLDAAARVYARQPTPELGQRMAAFVDLLARCQEADGYLYTYNQLHFPGQRWENLLIEHELYCHGHLIEAGVSHYQATGERTLLTVAERAADLLVREFLDGGPADVPGHQEIEIALLRLYRVTTNESYLELTERFVERRGRGGWPALRVWRENERTNRRSREVAARRAAYEQAHPDVPPVMLPPGNRAQKPPAIQLRFVSSALSGQYFQQHRPLRQQVVPLGHAVRFAYLETAAAMLCRERSDASLLATLERAWERMVDRRMAVTGGIGALPLIEGFGRDDELDPETSYNETCAALGALFWNWQMALATGQPRYADLFEWQLYNAAAVGLGLEGVSYLYNNPLASRGGVTRQPWFEIPCCPSNLSRTWASLDEQIYACAEGQLWVHQTIGSTAEVDVGLPLTVEMESALPWQGRVALRLTPARPATFTVHLRIPGWAESGRLAVNGQERTLPPAGPALPTASGIDPRRARSVALTRTWSPGDTVELEMDMPVVVRRAHPQVRGCRGRVALTRGPLVYCLESVDNPGVDVLNVRIDPQSARAEPAPGLLDGVWVLRGQSVDGRELLAIPYALWANRGESQMAVWLATDRLR